MDVEWIPQDSKSLKFISLTRYMNVESKVCSLQGLVLVNFDVVTITQKGDVKNTYEVQNQSEVIGSFSIFNFTGGELTPKKRRGTKFGILNTRQLKINTKLRAHFGRPLSSQGGRAGDADLWTCKFHVPTKEILYMKCTFSLFIKSPTLRSVNYKTQNSQFSSETRINIFSFQLEWENRMDCPHSRKRCQLFNLYIVYSLCQIL